MTGKLIDSFGRHIDYVRLSVTDRCHLRCFYCLPDRHRCVSHKQQHLNDDELVRLLAIFTGLGVGKVRLTGGEPLVRRDLAVLAARLARLPGLSDLSLSTNGMLLSKLAPALRRAGVARLNVSLDTLRPERFASITRGGRLEEVLAGLRSAQAAGFRPIRINMLTLKDFNEDEFEDMVRFCVEHDFTLRLIEPMPVGDPGRAGTGHYLDLQAVKQRLSATYRLTPSTLAGGGPARYYPDQRDLRAYRIHHGAFAAFLSELQPRATVRGGNPVPLSWTERQGRARRAVASGRQRRRTRARHPRGRGTQTGTTCLPRASRAGDPLHVHDRRLAWCRPPSARRRPKGCDNDPAWRG